MVYTWITRDAAGDELSKSAPFDSQAEAEAWMGSQWSALLASGGETVVLINGDETVYEMGLREA